MLLYLHHRDSKIFFHPAMFDNFKDEKISDFKTVSVSQRKNLLDWKLLVLWDYEQLLRGVFLCLRGAKKILRFFLKNILATALKSYIKWLLYFFSFFFWKSWKKLEKLVLSQKKFRYDVIHRSEYACLMFMRKFRVCDFPIFGTCDVCLYYRDWLDLI